MKVLYAIQGTGNGHVSRARSIVPILKQMADVDILVSGTESHVKLPFPIDYQFKGFSFQLNEKGGVDYARSGWNNFSGHLLREVKMLPVENYDLVINDFEPISAWAARFKKIPSVGLSHQASFLSQKTPRYKRKDRFGEFILRNYAPTDTQIGFHFKRYDSFIYPPVIREGIRTLSPTDKGYYMVYLPAIHDHRLIELLKTIPQVQWQVFSKYTWNNYFDENVWVRPISNETFVESFANCTGILTGGGFETPAEALFLGKKLMVVPVKGQYEQQCNAAALGKMGIPVTRKLKKKGMALLTSWVESPRQPRINFPDLTEDILYDIIQTHVPSHLRYKAIAV